MKRVLLILTAIIFAVTLFPVTALAESTDGNFTYEPVGDGTVRLLKYTGTSARQVVVPGTLGGLPVSEIGEKAFYDHKELTKITLPNSVTWILNYAFSSCTNLESIILPANLQKIEKYAFEKCSRLQNVELPTGIQIIGPYAFSGCTALKAINLPSSLTEIGEYAFSSCSSLEEINIPGTVKSIYEGTFRYCNSLKTVVLNEGTTALHGGDWYDWEATFLQCSNLTKLVVPDSVRTIGYYSDDRAKYNSLFCGADTSKLVIYCNETSAIYELARAWKLKTSVTLTPPEAPGGFKANPNNEYISLEWVGVKSAAGYTIAYSTNGADFKTLDTTTYTSYTHRALIKTQSIITGYGRTS